MSSDILDGLSEDEQQALVDIARREASGAVSRRGVMQGLGAIGVGAALAGGASSMSQPVEAAETAAGSGILWADSNASDLAVEVETLMGQIPSGGAIGIPIGTYTSWGKTVEITKDFAIVGPYNSPTGDGANVGVKVIRSMDAPFFTGAHRLSMRGVELRGSPSETSHLIDCTGPADIDHCGFHVPDGVYAVRLSTDGGGNVNHSSVTNIYGRGGGAVLVEDTAGVGDSRVMNLHCHDWRLVGPGQAVFDAYTRGSSLVIQHAGSTHDDAWSIRLRDIRNEAEVWWGEDAINGIEYYAGNQLFKVANVAGKNVDRRGYNGISGWDGNNGSLHVGKNAIQTPELGLDLGEDVLRAGMWESPEGVPVATFNEHGGSNLKILRRLHAGSGDRRGVTLEASETPFDQTMLGNDQQGHIYATDEHLCVAYKTENKERWLAIPLDGVADSWAVFDEEPP